MSDALGDTWHKKVIICTMYNYELIHWYYSIAHNNISFY